MRLIPLLLVLGCERHAPVDTDAPEGDTAPGVDSGDSGDTGGIAVPGEVKHVVVLVMDGTRLDESFGDGVSSAAGGETEDILPTFRERLFPEGTVVVPAYATGITITAPGHSDLVTGTRLPFANYPNDEGPGFYRPELPTLFEAVRDQLGVAASSTLLMGNTVLVEPVTASVYPGQAEGHGGDFWLVPDTSDGTDSGGTPDDRSGGDTGMVRPAQDDLLVMEDVKAKLLEEERRLLVVNLHDIDRAGHNGAAAGYAENVARVDEPLAAFWDWLQEQPTYAGNTVVVVVSDHGRHRGDAAEIWRNHGDHCAGCREIPLFVMGPGIRKGAVVTTPHTLEDVGRTVAAILGVDLPYADGRVITGIFDEAPAVADRAGIAWPDQAGGHTATQEFQAGEQRSRVVVDGEVLSSATAFAAERPRVTVSGDALDVCWRELTIVPGASSHPWTLQCRRKGADGAWRDIGFPFAEVGAVQVPSLVGDASGALWMGFADASSGAVDERETVRLLRYTDAGGWAGAEEGTTNSVFSTAPTLAVESAEVAWIAWGSSSTGATARDTRHVKVARVSWPEGGAQEWTLSWNSLNTFDQDDVRFARMEAPALDLSGSTVRLAFLGFGAEGNSVVVTSTANGGESWTRPTNLDPTRRALGHVTPVWSGDTLWFARLGATDTVEVCHWTSGDAVCADTGSPRILGLAPAETGVLVSVDAGTSQWELRTVTP